MEIIQPYSELPSKTTSNPFYRDVDPDPDLTYCIQQYRLIGPLWHGGSGKKVFKFRHSYKRPQNLPTVISAS